MATRTISAARVKLAELFAWQSIHDSHLNPFVDALNSAEELADALRWALGQIEDDLDPGHQAALTAARAALAAATGEA